MVRHAGFAFFRKAVTTKLDRGYDDFVSGRISEDFWTRKSQEWEAELQTVEAERARLEQLQPGATATAAKILELAKQAENLYKSQDPTEQRRCSKSCYRTAPSIAEVFLLLTLRHSTCWSEATKQGMGGVGGTRTRGLRRDRRTS
jgi:hypothetical protein